ncbi:hypothetical protein [Streptomyces sp. NPDC005799]|uniref:hypothetical protein n=1 Tax=Streptomyces sp. NPDC005799 TaxID=3154678 RepID=UPI003403187B
MPTPAQRPRLPETSEAQIKARYAWNEGKAGKPRKAADMAVVEPCTVDGCGTPVTDTFRPPADGMTRVTSYADGVAEEHWYCVGRCAAIACARAELRAIPMRSDGDR